MTEHTGRYSTSGRSATWWRVAQAITLVVTVGLVLGLVVYADVALGLLWNVAIPVLPATFLVTPILWRSVCPLATANMLTNGWMARRRLGRRSAQTAGVVGLVLLAILVPARLILLNSNGVALAALISTLLVAALVVGAFFDSKAGFCNAVCPVLAVERLYGQRPILNVRNPRCPDCTLCTSHGCIDLATDRAFRQAIGPKTASWRWLIQPYGAFGAAFPGFVLGYFRVGGVAAPVADFVAVASIYGMIAAYAVASWLIVAVIVSVLRIRSGYALPALAASAAAIYYWFASVSTADYLGIGYLGAVLIRSGAALLITWWLFRAIKAARQRRDAPMPGARAVLVEGGDTHSVI